MLRGQRCSVPFARISSRWSSSHARRPVSKPFVVGGSVIAIPSMSRPPLIRRSKTCNGRPVDHRAPVLFDSVLAGQLVLDGVDRVLDLAAGLVGLAFVLQ